jgi:hypothetical protein
MLLIVGHGLLLLNVLGLMLGLVRDQLKGFDNSPVGVSQAAEGSA